MFLFNTGSVLLALSSSTNAFPTFRGLFSRDEAFNSSVFEKLTSPPAGWVKDETAIIDKDASTVRLRFHLVQQDMSKFHDLAMNVISILFFNGFNIL
jgi:tripeptidyl-peptidase-1